MHELHVGGSVVGPVDVLYKHVQMPGKLRNQGCEVKFAEREKLNCVLLKKENEHQFRNHCGYFEKLAHNDQFIIWHLIVSARHKQVK